MQLLTHNCNKVGFFIALCRLSIYFERVFGLPKSGSQMDNQTKMQLARKRVVAKLGFYIHLALFAVVISILAFINWQSGAEKPWVLWPMFGWGLGLLAHGITVFSWSSRSKFIDRWAQKELDRME